MKRYLLLLALAPLIVLAADTKEEHMIQVRQSALRKHPNPFGTIIRHLSYGTSVTINKTDRSWAHVTTADGKYNGWLAASSLTDERLDLKASGLALDTRADSDEVALAGKGFNSQIEAEYRKGHADAATAFVWIDKMITWTVADKELMKFYVDGGLKTPARGAK